MKKSYLAIITVLVLLVVGAGLWFVLAKPAAQNGSTQSGSSQNTSSGNSIAPSANAAVDIKDFAFSQSDVTVGVGGTVTWTNRDSTPHTVTADTSSSDAPASDTLAQGQTYAFTFKKVGDYTYHCALHPHMMGTVHVVAN